MWRVVQDGLQSIYNPIATMKNMRGAGLNSHCNAHTVDGCNGLMDMPIGTNEIPVEEQIENSTTPFSIEIYLKQIGNDEVNAVNARELQDKLENKRDFSTWIKNRIEKYGFVENMDFVTLTKKVERQVLIEYFISLDMAKELSMVENNAQGKQARRYFIECEKKAKSVTLPTPTSCIELERKVIKNKPVNALHSQSFETGNETAHSSHFKPFTTF
jgi:phage anti-repressor protein